MSSFSSLASALLLLPGAILVERYGHRKEFTMAFGGGVARLAILSAGIAALFCWRNGHRLGGNCTFGDTRFVWEPVFSGLGVGHCRCGPHGRAGTLFCFPQFHHGDYRHAGNPARRRTDHPDIHTAWISDCPGPGICSWHGFNLQFQPRARPQEQLCSCAGGGFDFSADHSAGNDHPSVFPGIMPGDGVLEFFPQYCRAIF